MRRILYVEFTADGSVGGSHHSLLHVLRRLDPVRYRPLIAFYQDNPLVPEFRELTSEIVFLQRPSRAPGHRPLLLRRADYLVRGLAAPAWRAARLLRSRAVDLVHLNNSVVHGEEWMLAARLAGTRCVVHQRGYGYGRESNRLLARWADVVICCSDDVRRDLASLGVEPREGLVTVHDGLDPVELRSRVSGSPRGVREDFGVAETAPLVGMVGNIKEWKGQHILVEALALLAPRHPGLRCLIVGQVARIDEDGAFAARLAERIRSAGLEATVTLTGYRPDVPRIMNALDVVVHASIDPEPFGMVVVEAMALGKAVIATDHGGPREILAHGESGLLVPPGDPTALAGALDGLLRDPARRERLGAAARHRVEERFDVGRLAGRIEEIYGRLLG